MSKNINHWDEQFKQDAIRYFKEHPELSHGQCAENLGVSYHTLKNWLYQKPNSKGEVEFRGSGNYASDEAKEIARLKRELRDTRDALEILKKAIGILGKN